MAEIYNDTPDTLLSGTNSADTIKNGGYGGDIWHVGGSRVTIDAKNGDDYIRNLRGGSQSSINAGAGNDNIENEAAKNVTINGSKGNDTINNALMFDGAIGGFRYPDDVIIIGGTGNDLIYNSGSNVTIIGGTGNDTIRNDEHGENGKNVLFQYANGDGNDYIEGFNETSTLSIGGGSYSTTKSGDDLIVTVGEGKISLMGAASLSAVNIDGTEATSTTLTLTNSTKSPLTIGSAIKTVDASKRTTAIKITGNALANSIKGGSGNDTIYGGAGADKLLGGAGNDSLSGGDGKDKLLGGAGNDSLSGGSDKDTLSGGSGNDKLLGGAGNDCIKGGTSNDSLWGGTGNDTLWGDDGKDNFFYAKGDGKDIIYSFDNGDTLTLDGLDFTSSYSKSKGTVTLTFDSGSITFKKFTATTFHIDNDTYAISGSKLVKK